MILFYANGNNDLQPEINVAVNRLMVTKWITNITVVVQWASAPLRMVKLLRPNYNADTRSHWTGVRRYVLKGTNAHFLEDLGSVNMAEPGTLKEFIRWGVTNFPADHYMLILAGHGAGLVGLMPDYTHGCPHIMSIVGLKYALDRAAIATGRPLDILLLDTCYMNMVEIIYQLGSGGNAPKFIIAPQRTPLHGLPYQRILADCSPEQKLTPAGMVSNIMQVLNSHHETRKSPLAVIKPRDFWLGSMKKIINIIGGYLLKRSITIPQPACLPIPVLIETLRNIPGTKAKLYAWVLERCNKGLALPWSVETYNSLCIYLPSVTQFRYTAHYYRALKFIHHNRWLNYIAGKEISLAPPQGVELSPYLPLDGVINLISTLNPGISVTHISHIINQLGWASCPRLEKQ